MEYGLLALRLVLGLMLAAHGAQKLLDLRTTAAGFAHLRYRAPLVFALIAGLTELGAGLLFAAGFLTPLAALGLTAIMINAAAVAHWRAGFWNHKGGFEFNLLILAVAVAVVTTGPGAFSLDALLGWTGAFTGPLWALAVLALGIILTIPAVTLARTPEPASEAADPDTEHHPAA